MCTRYVLLGKAQGSNMQPRRVSQAHLCVWCRPPRDTAFWWCVPVKACAGCDALWYLDGLAARWRRASWRYTRLATAWGTSTRLEAPFGCAVPLASTRTFPRFSCFGCRHGGVGVGAVPRDGVHVRSQGVHVAGRSSWSTVTYGWGTEHHQFVFQGERRGSACGRVCRGHVSER